MTCTQPNWGGAGWGRSGGRGMSKGTVATGAQAVDADLRARAQVIAEEEPPPPKRGGGSEAKRRFVYLK